MIPLFEKYRPKTFEEIRGQDFAISKLKIFFSSFIRRTNRKNALLLYGPAGTGKTTLAIVLAKKINYELFELNASDLRNRKKLEEIMKPSIMQQSLFSPGKIILVDEVDGVTSTDYGGLAELITLIEKTRFPIIITANDIWQQKFSLLRKKCELVELKGLNYEVTLGILKDILLKEKMQYNEEIIKTIAVRCKGDLRAAINDLQSVIHTQESSVMTHHIYEREKDRDIFNALKELFKVPLRKETTEIYDNVNLELDQISLWIEKNIPKEYKGENLYKAFESLSKADLFKGRIYKQQHWRFLVYQNFFLTAGISSILNNNRFYEFTKYERPTRILKIWMANQRNIKKKSIAVKYAEYSHISLKRALKEFFLIALILNEEIKKKLQLTEQEYDFLKEYRGGLIISHNLNKFKKKI